MNQPLCIAGALLAAFLCVTPARAQDNTEIQVYGSDLVAPRETMVEIHSNFTVKGTKTVVDGVLPTNHAEHETLEITHGFTSWFETGFYVFSTIQPDGGWMWVGDHIRPRVAIPDSWHWPVGLSLSTEFGYQQRNFSTDTWTWEIRPIIDKKMGRWYLAFYPTAKVSYDFTKKIAGGIEYYGALGPITDFDPVHDQQQQIFPSIDLNVSPNWEFNFGVGVGATSATDHLIVKCIVGRRFHWGHGKKP